MALPYKDLFNRILDATAAIDIPVKLFVILVVLRYTPKDMRVLSLFLLNHMLWNFLSNIIFTFYHLYPLFPAACFHVNGIVNYFTDSEDFDHVIFFFLLFCIFSCGAAMALTFVYRYVAFVQPNWKNKLIWITVLYSGFIVLVGGIFAYLHLQWIVSYDNYPEKKDIPERKSLICFKPCGWEKDVK
uniref:Uncharacterized protein n=1 Tax=Steinernema glaseri TaxID=37863 RepID=A0A1I7Y298_9BILA